MPGGPSIEINSYLNFSFNRNTSCRRKTNKRAINDVFIFNFIGGALNGLYARGHTIQRDVGKKLESARRFRLYSLFCLQITGFTVNISYSISAGEETGTSRTQVIEHSE